MDYGCGTLRMGVHAIRFLERGRYWGFDIDQALLDEGARLIGAEMEKKAANLRVISASTVREAADATPAFLVSLKVLIHVHPDELDEYFGNILTIIGTSGRAILTGKWSSGEPFQFARQSWAHSLERLKETVARTPFAGDDGASRGADDRQNVSEVLIELVRMNVDQDLERY